MAKHPNRSRNADPGSNPKPERIRDARLDADLTQEEAGKLLYTSGKVWHQWESGARRMHGAFFELFLIKTKGKA